MERNKFEKELRDKMNQREIMPSENAWDRLDAMLTVAEEAKPKRHYNWLFIAATIIGFLLIGTVLVLQTEEATDKGREEFAIEDQTVKPSDAAQPQNVLPAVPDSEIASVTAPKAGNNQSSSAQNKNQHINHQSSPGPTMNWPQPISSPEKQIASNNQQSTQDQIITDRQSNNPIITRAKGELAPGNQKATQATADKVDELLAAVAPTQEVKPKTSVKVNAKSLLSEVDHQVNLSFREKMLRRAGEVAEAVANRNNE